MKLRIHLPWIGRVEFRVITPRRYALAVFVEHDGNVTIASSESAQDTATLLRKLADIQLARRTTGGGAA